MREVKEISSEKLYSILENVIFSSKSHDELYLLSFGNFKKEEYEQIAFSTRSKVIINKSLSIPLKLVSGLVASNLGLLQLERNRESLYELFFLCRFGTIYIIQVLEKIENDELNDIINQKNHEEVILALESRFNVLEINSEDLDHIVYFTKSDDIKNQIDSSIAAPIVDTVRELTFDEEEEISELDDLKIFLSGAINNNILNVNRSEYTDFYQSIVDLYMIKSFDNELLEYARLKAISYDIEMYNEIFLCVEYENYSLRIFPELNKGLCWAFNYLDSINELRELSLTERAEFKFLQNKIDPIRERIDKKINKSVKDSRFARIAAVVILLLLFGGYKVFKKYKRDYDRNKALEEREPERKRAARRIIDQYYPREKLDSSEVEDILKGK